MPANMSVTTSDRRDYRLWEKTDHRFTQGLELQI